MSRIMLSQVDMRLVVVYFFAATLICGCHGDQKDDTDAYLSRFVADLWLEGADVIKIIWRDCSKKVSTPLYEFWFCQIPSFLITLRLFLVGIQLPIYSGFGGKYT